MSTLQERVAAVLMEHEGYPGATITEIRQPTSTNASYLAYASHVLAALAQYVKDEMSLHDETGDALDDGYMMAVNEILACCATEGPQPKDSAISVGSTDANPSELGLKGKDADV